MKLNFSSAESFINRLILHSADNPTKVGLLNGQTGIIIVVAHYARQKRKPNLEIVADTLYDNVLNQVRKMHDVGFAKGLSGICWGIEYLVQHGILEDSSQEICGLADKFILSTNPLNTSDFSLETGLLGMWYYTLARMQGNILAGIDMPFPKEYLGLWNNILIEHAEKFPKGAYKHFENLMQGNLYSSKLSVRPFVKNSNELLIDDMSLRNGVAGYISLKYLNNV